MRRCLALFALPLLLGCGASARDLALVREDVTRLKHENQELTKRVGELEAREATKKAEATVMAAPPSESAPAAPAAPGESKPLKIVKLEPPKAPASAPVAPEPVVEDDEPRPLLKIGPAGAIEQTLPDEPAAKTKKKPSAPSLDPQAAKDYDAAYALVKAKKLQHALDALAGFLVRYPDHPYAANALYWRGECYWALGDYSSAATQFDALVARFPASGKTPDGLLKLGLAHRKLGSAGKAKVAFDRLRKEFPTSEAAKKIPPEDAS